MKIIIPIEVDIEEDKDTFGKKKYMSKCPTLNIGNNINGWEMSSWRKESLEESIISISNQIKNKITSEWLAMKIYHEINNPLSDFTQATKDIQDNKVNNEILIKNYSTIRSILDESSKLILNDSDYYELIEEIKKLDTRIFCLSEDIKILNNIFSILN